MQWCDRGLLSDPDNKQIQSIRTTAVKKHVSTCGGGVVWGVRGHVGQGLCGEELCTSEVVLGSSCEARGCVGRPGPCGEGLCVGVLCVCMYVCFSLIFLFLKKAVERDKRKELKSSKKKLVEQEKLISAIKVLVVGNT